MPDIAYIDACVFLEMLQRKDKTRVTACDEIRQKAEKGELELVTSCLTITEVNKLPELPCLPDEQSKQILEFFENPYIHARPVTREIAEIAHSLTRKHRLTNIDAIHIATALKSCVPVFYTYDGKKPKRKALLPLNKKIGSPPLRIEVPPNPFKGTLLEKVAEADDGV